MRAKRILAALLAAILTASALVLPAAAAPGSFSDITDQTTAVNADILRLMGVVSGVGGDRFEPNGVLTRAQFCTMVVNFLQKGDETARYATRTIFTDVGSTHWARSYINFAATYRVGSGEGEGSSGAPLVAGVGNGEFMPDNNITLAEAVTILLRALGYSGQQAGAVWPQSYLNLAGSIGLTDGVSSGASSIITRAQAARLFVNALKSKTAGGDVYYKSLGKTEKAILVEVNAKTEDGSARGALRTVIGSDMRAYLPARGESSPVSLQGRRGELVLNDQDEVVTFLPDNSTRVTAVLDGGAKGSSFRSEDGQQYTVSESTPVYVADDKEDSGYQASAFYKDKFESMVSGTQVTMYIENGRILTVFASIPGTAISTDAVVVMGSTNPAVFHQLTGGATDFNVRRGKNTIQLSDLKDYDVVTYDKVTNTLMASDLRLGCVYGAGLPTLKNPEKIKVLKTEFDVLESAWDTVNSFKPGDSVILLLTADGKVAGMTAANGKVRSNAVGELDGGVKIFLPNGKMMDLEGDQGSQPNSRLVTVSCNKEKISLSRLTARRAPGDYQVSGAKLGTLTVASDVHVYEQATNGAMAEVDVKELNTGSIPVDKVATYRQNSSGIVDFIVLENVTGNAYEYGMMKSQTNTDTGRTDENEDPLPDKTTITWKLVRGTPLDFAPTVGYNGKNGDMVGVITGTARGEQGGTTLLSVIQLTEIKGVTPSDFFKSQNGDYVTVEGRTYRVASDVECCYTPGNGRPGENDWLNDDNPLEAIKGYSENFTIYVDPIGFQVRIIRAS